jgi:hypothetical protein
MSSYRLPDGKITSDVDAWSKTWEDLSLKVEKALDVSVTAFDPGMQIRPNDSQLGGSCTIPMWLVQRIVKVTEKVPT